MDESSLPPGLFLTSGTEPFPVTLGAGEDFDDADFGYAGTGTIGDRVWHDLNGDGIQDAGEPGLNGVTVTLQGDLDGDGVEDITLTTVTANVGGIDGFYLFEFLPPPLTKAKDATPAAAVAMAMAAAVVAAAKVAAAVKVAAVAASSPAPPPTW